ncbi:hypothetical protein BDZ89DRAFT_1090988 [Hymenopellis radicata]|nr:hypothetical protein BDZ89DRAFT_1090988 [Hymenopellis radicata]
MDDTIPAEQSASSQEQRSPFLIRTFVKVGGFHRLGQFEDGPLPTTDEQQIFTWKDATLREVLTTLRDTAPHIAEYRHPLARFSFRTVYADATNKGRYAQKDLGQVYSRDILGEPGTLTSIAPRLLEDDEPVTRESSEKEREERTLDDLRLVPGDYLLVAVFLPKNVTAPSEVPRAPANNGWKSGPARGGDGGWAGNLGATGPAGRGGGGHWRGDSNGPGSRGRGARRGSFSDRDRDRDRDMDQDSRIPPPRRGERGYSPPARGSGGWGRRGARGGGRGRGGDRGHSRSRSRSRSRSPPPPRKNSRYD